jgi:hypothetical protein
METLMTQGGLTKDMIGKKLMTFGANGVSIFQGVKSRVTKQISDGWAPHSMGEHCMAHQTNLMIQTLSHLSMVNRIEGLLSTLYNYFCKSPKRYLEFSKLTKVMETKGAKILKDVKTQWISMLSLVKHDMAKYKTLFMKWPLTTLAMEKQKKTLTSFVMCKPC